MPSAFITGRQSKSGKRYAVRFRLGGRADPIQHGGSFGTMDEALARRDLIVGELAAGRNPADALRALTEQTPVLTLADWFEKWLTSRLDVSQGTLRNLATHWKRLQPRFGSQPPEEITHLDVQAWVKEQIDELEPATLRGYLGTLRKLLDYTGVSPNPARDRRVNLPQAEREVMTPPSAKHVLAILDQMPRERRLLFAAIEQTGVRVGEAVRWTWGDLDTETSRLLSRPAIVKGRRGRRKPRWVQLPEWLLELLLDSVPPDDRERERPLFGWPQTVRNPAQTVARVMAGACQNAGVPRYSPHDLRQRRISLWHGQGVPARDIGERVALQQVSTTLDTYTQVTPLEEISEQAYIAVLVWPPSALDG
jgi:integrase